MPLPGSDETTAAKATHLPVLLEETLDLLQPERGGVFIDATLGLAGHSLALAERARQAQAGCTLYGIDQDPHALAVAKQRLKAAEVSATLIRGNFADLAELIRENRIPAADGILMDIGVSSMQIDTAERGFSFTQSGPLDMRMDPDEPLTAADIVNRWSERELADLFWQFGEERLSRKIARQIVEERRRAPITETGVLAELVTRQYHPAARYKHPHPATRVFQALRIAVNSELAVLEQGITAALAALAPAGVLAVISFHSLEDRIVKHAFRAAVQENRYELLTKKPLVASEAERSQNVRSRSAKLRGIRRLAV